VIFYEAPHRVLKFLGQLLETFGDRNLVIAREISKIYETYTRTTLKKINREPEMLKLKGEFVIIVEGRKKDTLSDDEIILILKNKMKDGGTVKSIAKEVADEVGLKRNKIYELALKLTKAEKD